MLRGKLITKKVTANSIYPEVTLLNPDRAEGASNSPQYMLVADVARCSATLPPAQYPSRNDFSAMQRNDHHSSTRSDLGDVCHLVDLDDLVRTRRAT